MATKTQMGERKKLRKNKVPPSSYQQDVSDGKFGGFFFVFARLFQELFCRARRPFSFVQPVAAREELIRVLMTISKAVREEGENYKEDNTECVSASVC